MCDSYPDGSKWREVGVLPLPRWSLNYLLSCSTSTSPWPSWKTTSSWPCLIVIVDDSFGVRAAKVDGVLHITGGWSNSGDSDLVLMMMMMIMKIKYWWWWQSWWQSYGDGNDGDSFCNNDDLQHHNWGKNIQNQLCNSRYMHGTLSWKRGMRWVVKYNMMRFNIKYIKSRLYIYTKWCANQIFNPW